MVSMGTKKKSSKKQKSDDLSSNSSKNSKKSKKSYSQVKTKIPISNSLLENKSQSFSCCSYGFEHICYVYILDTLRVLVLLGIFGSLLFFTIDTFQKGYALTYITTFVNDIENANILLICIYLVLVTAVSVIIGKHRDICIYCRYHFVLILSWA
jgi:hypothetical protein